MSENEQVTRSEHERPRSVNSLLSVGDTTCDKCGRIIRQLDRYYYSTIECPICGATFETIADRDGHFSQEHPHEPTRGARYCQDCSIKAGYLKE